MTDDRLTNLSFSFGLLHPLPLRSDEEYSCGRPLGQLEQQRKMAAVTMNLTV